MKIIKSAINIVSLFVLGLLIGFPGMLVAWANGKIDRQEAIDYAVGLFKPWNYTKSVRTGQIWFWENR